MEKEKVIKYISLKFFNNLSISKKIKNYKNYYGNYLSIDFYSSIYNQFFECLYNRISIFIDSDIYITKSYKINRLEDHFILFNETYPKFELVINESMYKKTRLINDIIKSFIFKRDHIENIVNSNKISNVILGLGDNHSGKEVSLVVFNNNEKMIYKPRNNDIEEFILKKINPFLNDKIGHTLLIPESINSINSSWHEFINYNPPKELIDIKKYYLNSGRLLGTLWILGSNDMHYENIISSFDSPIAIDLETISKGFNLNMDLKDYLYSLNSSVISTSLIPSGINTNNIIDIDMNGIFPKKQVSKKIYTDLHGKKTYFKIDEEKNYVYYNNEPVKPELVKNELKKGFFQVLNSIINNKKEFTDIVKSGNKLISRQLLRDTHVYANFKEALLSPDALSNIKVEEKIIDIYEEGFNYGKFGYLRLKNELNFLKKYEIPTYYTQLDSCNLLSSDKKICIKNYWKKSPLDTIVKKIEFLDNKLINYQLKIIELSMCLFYNPNELYYKYNFNNLFKHKHDFINANEMISQYRYEINNLLKVILRSKNKYNKRYISTFDVNVLNNVTEITTFGRGILNIDSLPLFFLRYGKFKKDDYLIKLSKEMYVSIYHNFMNECNESNNFSVFSGIGGAVYCSIYFYLETKDLNYYDDFNEMINMLLIRFDNINKNSILKSSSVFLLLWNSFKYLSDDNKSVFINFAKSNIHYFRDFLDENSQDKSYKKLLLPLISYSVIIKLLCISNDFDFVDKIVKKLICKIYQRIDDLRLLDGVTKTIDTLIIVNNILNNRYSSYILPILKKIDFNNFSKLKNYSVAEGIYGAINSLYSWKEKYNVFDDDFVYFTYMKSLNQLKIVNPSSYKPMNYSNGVLGIMDINLRKVCNMPNILYLDLPNER